MMRVRSSGVIVLALSLAVSVVLYLAETNPAMAQTQSIGSWAVDSDPGLDGSAPQWQSILPVVVATTSQQVTPPMGGGNLRNVAVRSVHWNERLYVMVEWIDSTADMTSDRPEEFTDAVAVQFPAEAASSVPAICMGQADQAVNIWQWRGDQQGDEFSLPADGYVDLYPSTDDLYYTARAAGNPLAQVESVPAQNLVAGGFGTLTSETDTDLEGLGVHSAGRWLVVFSRSLTAHGDLQPDFTSDTAIDVAFAAWDGTRQERNGIKSVSSFTRLALTNEDPPRRAVAATDDWPAYQPSDPIVAVAWGFIVILVGVGIAIWFWGMRREGSPGNGGSDAEDG